jgi:hypothetical protein
MKDGRDQAMRIVTRLSRKTGISCRFHRKDRYPDEVFASAAQAARCSRQPVDGLRRAKLSRRREVWSA